MFLMFDARNEALAQAAGLTPLLPSAALRNRIDDKLATTRLGNEAGVRSVPHVLGAAPAQWRARAWRRAELRSLAS